MDDGRRSGFPRARSRARDPRRRHRHRRQPRPPVRLRLARARRRRRHLCRRQRDRRAWSPRTRSPCSNSPDARTFRSRSAPTAPLVKPLETTEETHGPRGIGYAVLPPATRPLDPRHARGPDRRTGAGATRRDPPRDARPADEPRPRTASASRVSRALLVRLDLHGWRVPRAGQHHADRGVERPRGPRRGEGVPLGLGRRRSAADPTIPLPIGMGLDVTELARLLPGDVARLARRAGAAPSDADALAGAGGTRPDARHRIGRDERTPSGSSPTPSASTSSSMPGTTASTARSSTIRSSLPRPPTRP